MTFSPFGNSQSESWNLRRFPDIGELEVASGGEVVWAGEGEAVGAEAEGGGEVGAEGGAVGAVDYAGGAALVGGVAGEEVEGEEGYGEGELVETGVAEGGGDGAVKGGVDPRGDGYDAAQAQVGYRGQELQACRVG